MRMIGSAVILVALSTLGCTAEVASEEDAVGAVDQGLRVDFEPFSDPLGIGTAGEEETRVLIRSADQYEQLFGHAPPDGVDFDGGDLVLFYSAGVQLTGGYEASIDAVDVRGRVLRVQTRLVSPGEGCVTTDALTTPYVLATFQVDRRIRRVRFRHVDEVRDCPDDPCASVSCAEGSQCEVQPDGTAACVAVGPFCGGIAGFPCPGAGTCVDDPTDDCDPNMGGADCGGRCVCNALGLCVDGFVWDSQPDVCGCVELGDPNPCAAVLCLVGTTCELVDGEPVCVPAEQQACGASTCPVGEVCCNASCGICTEPGGFCTQQECL
jgi:hypothetical protein